MSFDTNSNHPSIRFTNTTFDINRGTKNADVNSTTRFQENAENNQYFFPNRVKCWFGDQQVSLKKVMLHWMSPTYQTPNIMLSLSLTNHRVTYPINCNTWEQQLLLNHTRKQNVEKLNLNRTTNAAKPDLSYFHQSSAEINNAEWANPLHFHSQIHGFQNFSPTQQIGLASSRSIDSAIKTQQKFNNRQQIRLKSIKYFDASLGKS